MEDDQIKNRKFSWLIENVYLCNKLLESSIEGPQFEDIEFSECPWVLQLGQSTRKESDGIRLFIKRDGAYKEIVVNFRVLVFDENHEKLLNKKFRKSFKEGFTWESSNLMTNIEFRGKFLSREKLGKFWEIRVELMYNEPLKAPKYSNDLHFKRMVGVDLKKCLDDPNFSDTILYVGDDEVKAHKAILHARSVYFARKLGPKRQKKPDEDVIPDFPLPSAKIVKWLLLYIYSGDIYSLIDANDPLPIEIHKYAKQMRLYDLEWLTEPFKVAGSTYIDAEHVTATFIIEGFSKELKNYETEAVHYESPPFGNLDVFQLVINIERSSLNVYVALRMQSGEETLVFLEVSIKSKSKVVLFKKKLIGNLKPDSCMELPEFMKVDELLKKREYTLEGNLCLLVKLVCSKGELETEVGSVCSKSCVDPIESKGFPEEVMYCASHNGYCGMSKDMKALLQTAVYSDCTLVMGEIKFPAHKVILAARSSYFFDKFKEAIRGPDSMDSSEEDVVKEQLINISSDQINITIEQMNFILEEIYTGAVEINSVEFAKTMKLLSKYFGISSLGEKCELYLKANEVTGFHVLSGMPQWGKGA